MGPIQWIGAHVDCYNHSYKNKLVDYFNAFYYKDTKFKVGDFVLLKDKELRVAKLISVFHSYEKKHIVKQHRGIVQLYLWAKDLNQRINGSYLKLNEDHEVIETTELTTNSIDLEEIEEKCQIIFASVDDPVFQVNRNNFKFRIFCCRYKLDCDLIVPLYPNQVFNGEDTLSESDYVNSTILSSPINSPLKRKPDCTPINVDSEESELEIDKVRSIIIPLKNLKLTPNEKFTGEKDLHSSVTKNNSVKRVLVDSFDESSGVSYSVVNTRFDNESIKVTLKVANVTVHPTILTDEIITMRSPIKLRHIEKVDNRIEMSENGRIELSRHNVELSETCLTPTRTPAKINVRRSTRTIEKKSYKQFYSSEYNTPHSNLRYVDRPSLTKTLDSQKPIIRTPKRYEDSTAENNLPRRAKIRVRNYRNDSVSLFPEITPAKKTCNNSSDTKCVDKLATRKSQRTIRRSIRYLDTSIIDCDEIIVNSEDDEVLKPKRNTRNSNQATVKTSLKSLKEDELTTPIKLKNATNTPKTKDTPFSRAKLVREGVITPGVQSRQKAILKDDTPLSKARNQLHVSYVPQGLPCREQEYLGIANFLKGKLLDGCGGCMYVSGVPGTGKTATVTDVVNSLQELTQTGKIPSFKYVNINGMRLSEPRQAYVEIAKQLLGKTLRWEQAQTTLESIFVKIKKKSVPIIMVIDELDILCTKRQDVVYNLLDWPTKANAQLIVITIANTMDLPERLLMGRVTSRLGLTRLTFQAYTHKQLQEIVTKRLLGTDAFNPDAVQLVARKVASVSGDARRALDICRRAAEIAELEGRYTLVAMNHVNEALNSMITQPKVQAIKQCSRLEKLILQSVVAEVERTGVEETNFSSVFTMLQTIAAVDGFEMVSRSTVMTMITRLGACRLLLTDQKCNDIHQRIILNASTDDIHYALMKTDI
ncbi:hypothetical protein RN001_001224 [Aquatica leii]|uniref:Origin recognition complex subunit 1 n=1 Tax=Aquatica leii TaxID=1421715 RepID=A0AAN7SQU2_9COLE|nr:hypothetical protein RN001_001224 [Aquatica leii]